MHVERIWEKAKGHGLVIVLALLLVMLAAVSGVAQTGPNTMNFQGRLLDSGGEPRGGETHCMRFRMCSDANCTAQVWPNNGYEKHAVTTESGAHKAGLFNVSLGTSRPISPTLISDCDTVYIEIGVADEATCPGTTWSTMLPRSQVQASVYAHRSRRVYTQESAADFLINVENTGDGGAIYASASSGNWGTAAGKFEAKRVDSHGYGVLGTTWSAIDAAAGGYFWAQSTSGETRGVVGANESTTDGAAAGYFLTTGSTGETYAAYGQSNSTSGHGGHFVNLNTDTSSNQVGLWAGSFYNNIIEGHELSSNGLSMDRRMYLTRWGDMHIDGTYYGAGGVSVGNADFAEMVEPASADLAPGDVLCVGSDGHMSRCVEAYQPTVVGVYSTEPGFIAGNKLDDEGNPLEPDRIPLAIVGIVPVKASAENGAIQPGDLLVASTTPGHAMRGGEDPPQGTVIGKSLEGLEDGAGIIQMLVTLQ